MLKIILNKQKRGLFSCGTHVDATWHSEPYGSATWERLCGADVTCIFIFIVIIRVTIHIGILYLEFKLTLIFCTPYKLDRFL